uniref:Glutathione S-transferase n=1 Tax=Cebus imitator TaxID=2715852 RepID=A0A2K5RVL4_CEBIM
MPMTLGYRDLHGLAHTIRLLLEYTDSSYEEKTYTMGDTPEYDRSQWLKEKFKLGLDFPNLNAILHYIAHKHNLCGETEEEKIRVDILENQTMDTRMKLVMICYDSEFEKLKPKYLEELPEKLKLYSQFLGKRPRFAGDKITFVDFLAYDILDHNRIFEPHCLDGLKKISAYMKSRSFIPGLLFGKSATWNST